MGDRLVTAEFLRLRLTRSLHSTLSCLACAGTSLLAILLVPLARPLQHATSLWQISDMKQPSGDSFTTKLGFAASFGAYFDGPRMLLTDFGFRAAAITRNIVTTDAMITMTGGGSDDDDGNRILWNQRCCYSHHYCSCLDYSCYCCARIPLLDITFAIRTFMLSSLPLLRLWLSSYTNISKFRAQDSQ